MKQGSRTNINSGYHISMKKVTHIVPVGHTKAKLIDGIKQFPVYKAILLLGEDPDLPGEDIAVKTAGEVEKALKGFIETEKEKVNKEDIFSAALKVIKIIKKEKKEGRDVKINISGSMRTLSVACYIAASITKTEVYATLSEYEDGKVVGAKKVYDVPLFPVKEIPPERMEILNALTKGEVKSIEELISILKPNMDKTTKEYENERARLSYHTKFLREDGLVKTRKSGKNVGIRLTSMGMVYTEGSRS